MSQDSVEEVEIDLESPKSQSPQLTQVFRSESSQGWWMKGFSEFLKTYIQEFIFLISDIFLWF